jgi:tetratricopeptide (TPR) repeat protein
MARRNAREYLAAAKAVYEQKTTLEQAARAGDPEAAVNLGLFWARGTRQHMRRRARAAYEQAMGSGHPEWAPAAAFHLGNLLRQDGDTAGARAAYEQAIESGDVARARSMFEFAVTSGPPARAAPAAYTLGRIREELGDLDGARAAYQDAIDSGDPEPAKLAAARLARLTPS